MKNIGIKGSPLLYSNPATLSPVFIPPIEGLLYLFILLFITILFTDLLEHLWETGTCVLSLGSKHSFLEYIETSIPP